ncbi:IclR family transcriptional regulator [Aquamicrobium sp. LC103]|uniref:IclR family transcriptional regulator n=1 Tax=Aquamicrobium sp. LC103 TaxID=1120658 RepID=UPI00063EB495|nr:IclR family transcriptional regulator [Aquamicrobium sp. LC103]
MTKNGGNSLERVLAVLEVFSENHLEWTPEELMEELGYSRPTLYRYLKTLREAGLLTSMPNAGFTLGPKVVEMDYLLRKSDALILNGSAHLKNLTERYSCTALLVRWYGDKLLCVDSLASVKNPRSSYPRGRPMPLGRGAIARSIMAFLPRRHLMPMIERTFDELRAVGLGNTPDEIVESLKRVRKAGYAVAFGEVTPGVVGIAAPVFDAGQSPIASVCVTIAGHLVNGKTIEEISLEVRGAATQVSEALSLHRHGVDTTDILTE